MHTKLPVKSIESLFDFIILIEETKDKKFLMELLDSYGCKAGVGNGLDIFTSGIERASRWVVRTKVNGQEFDVPRVFTTHADFDVSFHNLDFQIPDRQTNPSTIMNLLQ